MSNNWIFFPSPAAATGLDLIAKATNWQVMNNNSILAAGGITQGLWPTIYSQWGGAITITTDRTLNGFMVFDTIGEYTAFYNAHTGAQGMLLTHRGHNGTISDPAKYYLWVGTYAQLSWTGRYASFVPTTRWMGEQMTGYYTSTNPSELRALKTIDLQMGASITSVGSGSPPQDAYTGGMTSTTTGTQPTGISSLQHRTYGMGFIFGTNAQRNTFVGNYPNDVGTWYVGLGDSLSFTKPGWTWDLNVGGTTNRAYISVANHEVWHAPNTFAVGDDVQIIHTA